MDRWLTARGFPHGETLSIEQVWRLAQAWYTDPRAADWRPRTAQMSANVLRSVGLESPFWQLL